MTEKKIGPLERDAQHYVQTHTPEECADAARKMHLRGDHLDTLTQRGQLDLFNAFRAALMLDGGDRWADALHKAGFVVHQAV